MDLARSACYLEYAPCRVRCPGAACAPRPSPGAARGALHARLRGLGGVAGGPLHRSAVSELARVEWHSVGGVCRRVYAELEESARGASRFDGVRRIGIDETSYKDPKYVTVVVDHDRGCLIWAHGGHRQDVLNLFLDELTREQRRAIEVVTRRREADRAAGQSAAAPTRGGSWTPFHVVQWMNDALDAVRCEGVERRQEPPPGPPGPGPRQARQACQRRAAARGGQGAREEAASIKGSRYALVKNPEDLTDGQRGRGSGAQEEGRLAAAGQGLGAQGGPAGRLPGSRRLRAAAELLDDWMHRAAYCKIAKVVAVEKKVRRRRDDIIAAVELGIGNGRVEAVNNKIKVTVRMGYGFRNTDNLVALLMLRCGDCQPQLPGRPVKARKKGVKGAKSVAA